MLYILVLLVPLLLVVTIKNMAYSQTRSMKQSHERASQQAVDESEESSIEQSIDEFEERSVEQPVADSIEQELIVPDETESKKSKKISIIPPPADGSEELINKQLEGTGLIFLPGTRGNAIPHEILEDKNRLR